MADIFLSYAKEDRTIARTIAQVLESCGWSVFWDRKIVPGDDWRQVVQTELDAASTVVVLWSDTSVASTWVIEEAERGRTRLVSVLITQAALPFGFGVAQAIDLINWKGGRTEGVTALVDAVAKTLQSPPPRAPRVPASPSRTRGIALATVLLAAVATAWFLTRPGAPPPWMNQEILLDTSDGMKNDFDGKPSKLMEAVNALDKRVFGEKDNVALRVFGGPCNQGGRLLVPFGTNGGVRLKSASKDVQATGQSTLVSAVIAALQDIERLPNTRRVIVITGHADQCNIEEPIREIKQRVASLPKTAESKPVVLEFRFIGLGIPPSEMAKIQEVSNAVDGQAYFVKTPAELNDVLQYVLEFEPAVAHVRNVWSIVDEVGKSMSGVAQNMNGGKADEATSILDAGQTLYGNMRQSFDSLAGLQPSVNFQRFYTLAADNRALQAKAFAAGRAWIGGGALPTDTQSPGYEAAVKQWNERVATWNDIVGKYNANINEMNRLTNEIVKDVRRSG